MKTTTIVGISALYHDSAVAIIRDGAVVCAAQEERFTRIKNDASFPSLALRWCLAEAGIENLGDIDYVVFYEKPLVKFERLMESHIRNAPRGISRFARSMPAWIKQKLMARRNIERAVRHAIGDMRTAMPTLLFNDHHGSHAASAFFPSPFEEAAVLCLDGVGEWDSSTAWTGKGNTLTPLWRIPFPHSLGLLYSAFTVFCGFKVNSGEHKLMGLAPFGEPVHANLIESKLVNIKPDGSFHMNMEYFSYQTGLQMTNRKFAGLFGGPQRCPDAPITQREMDIAASIQAVTEKIVVRSALHLQKETGMKNLCLGGGVALNCVANGVLHRTGAFENIWIPPSPGDSGSAIGCALSAWHEFLGKERRVSLPDGLNGGYLGPEWSAPEITRILDKLGAHYESVEDHLLFPLVAGMLAQGKVIGWFQGRMEFGPRALGARSILGDPRNPKMISRMNLKIKYRESFRPFAPSILAEHVSEWFDHDNESPYMLMVANVAESRQKKKASRSSGLDTINEVRSDIPAVTHVNMTARLHTVTRAGNPRFHQLISCFQEKTGTPLLINTSFNVRGEPIVATPEDAWKCFMGTDMDALVIGNCVLLKDQQPSASGPTPYFAHFEAD